MGELSVSQNFNLEEICQELPLPGDDPSFLPSIMCTLWNINNKPFYHWPTTSFRRNG